tara:strand:- start:118 stop:366 length:249 start_codon:yes stop_codon:yes gene_type:complete
MSDFKDKLNKLLSNIEDEVLFTFVTKIDNENIRLFVTGVEYQDNGFMIDFFSDSKLTDESEKLARSHLARHLLHALEKESAG